MSLLYPCTFIAHQAIKPRILASPIKHTRHTQQKHLIDSKQAKLLATPGTMKPSLTHASGLSPDPSVVEVRSMTTSLQSTHYSTPLQRTSMLQSLLHYVGISNALVNEGKNSLTNETLIGYGVIVELQLCTKDIARTKFSVLWEIVKSLMSFISNCNCVTLDNESGTTDKMLAFSNSAMDLLGRSLSSLLNERQWCSYWKKRMNG